MQWIKYLSTTEGGHIQHARNGGEKEIGPYKVDGYYENEKDRNTYWNLTESSGTMFTLLQCQHGQPGQWYDHG